MAPAEDLDLPFSLAMAGEDLLVTDPSGQTRAIQPPWKQDNQFWRAHHFYDRLTREPVTTAADRADLFTRATTLGSLLFGILFDEEGKERLRQAGEAITSDRPRSLITIRSEDDDLLALPWELLFQDGSFLLKDARVDLARSTPGEALLREPDGFLKLVVNVSAPEESGLDYEGESYRVTKALAEQCRFVPTELGTVEDLIETVRVEKPTAIHFSGHGAPAALVFEDDEGRADLVPIHDLLLKLRTRIDGPLPSLFYLASCHGNDAGGEKAETSAARLHREGVPQVVGYDGPINDELSTRAEVAFYRALAEGGTTRYAVRQAREALAEPFHPFAWAQLVFYHRGPDYPLSLPAAQGLRQPEEALRRTFTGVGDRKILTSGFIGRRSEMHQVRRRIRRGDRVIVFQGLGGLGKSALAFHVLPMIQREDGEALVLWCREVEQQPDRLEGLVGQLLDHCRKRFGLGWEQVVHQVDRAAGDDSLQRFSLFLQALLQNVPRLVLYLDNLESLQVGPEDSEAEETGEWASQELGRLWELLMELARQAQNLYVVASCRYQNPDFGDVLLPVSPLPPDALLRLLGWFPSLRRLSFASQVRLAERLAGHPRAVEYADDLMTHAFVEWEEREERDPWREWSELVEPALPKVREKLQANLLLAEIWDRVLTDRERRMLYRMTLLRRPWQWPLVAVLGEEEGDEAASATASRLLRTSLLEQLELRLRQTEDADFAPVRHFALHPSTVQFVRERFGDPEALRRTTHRRLGDRLETELKRAPLVEVALEAGYHLFQAGEYDRAEWLLGGASKWLQEHGRAREGLRVLEPFLLERVRSAMTSTNQGRLLGMVGIAHIRLGEPDKAIRYHEQALVIHRETGNRQEEIGALGNLGIAYRHLGEMERAIELFEQSLSVHRELGDRMGESHGLGNLGSVHLQMGRFEKALEYYEQYLAIAREIGDRQGESNALGNLGVAYRNLGELGKAIGCYEQQLEIARAIGHRQWEGNAIGNLGVVHRMLGDLERALDYYEQHLAMAREIGDRHGEARALGNAGVAYADLGETGNAIALLERALSIARAIKDPGLIQNTSAALETLRQVS